MDKNRYRSIVLAEGGLVWVYVYLFAKKDQDNIDDSELKAFKKLAEIYAKKSMKEIEKELKVGELAEICI